MVFHFCCCLLCYTKVVWSFQSVDWILTCDFSMQSLNRIFLYYTVLLFYTKCGASFGTAVDKSAMCDQLESGYRLPVTDSLWHPKRISASQNTEIARKQTEGYSAISHTSKPKAMTRDAELKITSVCCSQMTISATRWERRVRLL